MLDFDPEAVAIPGGHFIDGGRVAGGETALPVLRPSDGRAYAELPVADEATVDRAVASARRAFSAGDWARRAPRERARVLRRWADLVEARTPELARLEALGSTRPIAQAAAWDLPYLAETLRFFAELADKHGGEVAATGSDRLGLMLTEPYGVVAAIAPWNFPLVMAGWKIAPALAAGNAVVLKPSEMTPFSVLRVAALGVEAGLPPGIFNVVQGDGETSGAALVRHPAVGKITFTGSTRAGSAIMASSAAHGLKPVTLELGGKSPQLVFADADPALAAGCVARAILGNAGQVCVAGSRLIVHRSLRDEILERLAEPMTAVAPGPTWHEASRFSPIVSARQLERIDDIVRRSLAAGAEAPIGGGPLPGRNEGSFYAPTILTGVGAETPAVREEIFGPVLTVQSFEDEEEGLALAAHPDYGLAAGLYTRDLDRALRTVRRIEAGTVWINRYGRSDDLVIPTGGFKRSGLGKDLGRQAFEANLRLKSVLIGIGA